MSQYPADIYTEQPHIDTDTLRNLGPLAALAGVWQGTRGLDVKPKADGPRKQAYEERFELQPLDPACNGPQLFYGLRYHQFANKPGEAGTYHDQVGYFLWEPATETIIQTLTIPRGLVAMAVGEAKKDARAFELVSRRGNTSYGALGNPFLDQAFKTTEYRIQVTVNDDGTWTYAEDTVLEIRGQAAPFHHTDTCTLKKIAEPTPNPMAPKK